MSTERPVLSAHLKPSTASGETLVKTVDREIGTPEEEIRVSIAGSGFSRSKGIVNEIIWESLEFDLYLSELIYFVSDDGKMAPWLLTR